MRPITRQEFVHVALGSAALRDEVLKWKKAGNWQLKDGITPPPPPALTGLRENILDWGLDAFDIITVPPPSFHEYEIWYPALILAESLVQRPITLLWPERYTEKKTKRWQANIDKVYSAPAVDVRGKFVLLLDDVATTGLTLSAACRAICEAGGYPLALSVC